MTTSNLAVRRAHRAYVTFGIVLPLLVGLVGVGLMLLWLPEMPETIAIHWDASGADGFGPAWSTPVILAATVALIVVLLAACALPGWRAGEWGPTQRFVGALGPAIVVFLTVGITWSFGTQRGLTDPTAAPSILLPFAVGALTGAVVGVIAWFAQPAVTLSGGSPAGHSPADITLGQGEQAVWLRTTTMSTPGLVFIVLATLLMAGLAVVFVLSDSAVAWVIVLLAVLLLVLTVTMCVFRVRVDAGGLRVASLLGIPRFRVPLADIASVSVIEVSPMSQFGGWGIRLSLDGRFGVVMHRGEAIEVTRHRGRTFVVTVDDAETGAGLLDALAERAERTA
ncbi:DUF1648 domain-containing protein [Microbacterium koreense]|uniref:DUF1648 domain-containing protein n=1 Tax=Microbacterium koreense TaxID=323761 RepID=A0ABW2ZS27_9MICO